MNFTFITLAIFSCICSKVNNTSHYGSYLDTAPPVTNGCFIKISWEYARKLPIIFTSDDENAKIIDPYSEHFVKVNKWQNVKIACVKTQFDNFPSISSGILITCVNDDTWLYQNTKYKFKEFLCTDTPKSELIVTSEKCQADKYVVAKVGFQTENHFFDLYSICFNKSFKSSVYTWYYTKPPYFKPTQISYGENFMTTKQLFGETDVRSSYSFSHQVQYMSDLLGSKEQAKKYLRHNYNPKDSYLSHGFLTPILDFYFPYQQYATFFYANIAPQWLLINTDIWSSVENTVRRKIHLPPSKARHLVVTGTYGICTLFNEDKIRKPLFLDKEGSIRVPMFFWKLLYNLDEKNGLVYIVMNNPFMSVDNQYFCKNACPDEFSKMPFDKSKLVFCCTIESFVKLYGKLDSILFDGEMATNFLSRTPENVAETPSWTESFSPRV